MNFRKKLIEVALPLDAINKASAREKSIRHGHPSTLHLWWARRPLAAARAVIFAQMVDDPSSHPELFPTEVDQERERQRLFRIIEDLVQWKNTTNEKVLQQARDEIWQSWRYTCDENAHHPRAKELFDCYKLPAFHDPFAGGGALPLEAQRLGLESHASDLNPVAVLINKAMIEIPPKYVGIPPVNPEFRRQPSLITRDWEGAQGLLEDVRYYANWIRNEADRIIGHLYPKIEITPDIISERPDLKHYIGKKLTVIAWLWARTVKSPNPAFAHVDVPLISSFMLSTKKGKEVYIEPIITGESYRFAIRMGKPKNPESVKMGTSVGKRGGFYCMISGAPIPYNYIRDEGKSGRIGERLIAIVAEGNRERIYLPPTNTMENIANKINPSWIPETPLEGKCRVNVSLYGFDVFADLFTPRQLVTMTTFSDLVQKARERVKHDAILSGISDLSPRAIHKSNLEEINATDYANAVSLYLGLLVDKMAFLGSSMSYWEPVAQCPRGIFGRQAIAMTWDYTEPNIFSNSSGSWSGFTKSLLDGIETIFQRCRSDYVGFAFQADATDQSISKEKIVSTDPPYYDNIAYADLSDFFYVWLRRSLKSVYPDLFFTLAVPKENELVATPYRHTNKEKADMFFLDGMTKAMNLIAEQVHPAYPVTIYYAFKQSESKISVNEDSHSTGWETFLEAMIKSGLTIIGTWPIRTEMTAALKDITNSLASSIILVCRKREDNTLISTRREFIGALKESLPVAFTYLQQGNIAPVDLAQAAIGPGMAVFTRYAKVLDAQGRPLSVRQALSLINQVLDEVLAEQEGDFDADTRWALAWFEQMGFDEGEFGIAETLSKAKDTSVAGMVEAGILVASRGKVHLLKPTDLSKDWDPTIEKRLTVWEMVHHLIRALESDGESAAANILAQLGSQAETARELCYRLYTICERKKRAAEALSYNALVQSWPEITRLAREISQRGPTQASLF
jgi:putative DNA methylase